MPRDPRPFVTYPLNYTGHPRIESLSDAAFRAFHEMNDYSRVHGLDGLILIAVARKRWPSKVLTELVNGIDDRPLVVLTAEAYLLRSYAEHQFTTTDAEALRSARAEAGRKGGEAKARAKQAASNRLANASRGGWQNVAESESDDLTKTSMSQSLDNRARVSTTQIEITEGQRRLAGQQGITSLPAVIDMIGKHTHRTVDAAGALRVCLHLLDKAKTHPRAPQRYVLGAISRSSFEVQQYIDEQALAVTP